jgi:radical SAM superfamily enzyme
MLCRKTAPYNKLERYRMSNASLVVRISEIATQFEAGETSFVHLQDVLENTAKAIESLPYNMVIELRSIESRLAIEQGFEEEDCESKPKEVLAELRSWLERVPQ